MRLTRCVLLLSLASVVACDRVTAPEALKAADRIEAEVARGKFDNFHELLMFGADVGPVPFGQRARGSPFVPVTATAPLFIQRDDATEQVNAFVIERVFVPPGDGGTPLRRRTLVVWPDSFDYSLVAKTQNGASGITREGFWPGAETDHLHPPSGARLARPRNEDSWIGRSGSVSIEPAGADSACPFFGNARGNGPVGAPVERVDCHATTFAVQMDAEFDRAGDTTLAHLTRLTTIHRVRVVEQRTPGLRFTVHCAKLDFKTVDWSKVDTSSPCYSFPEAFWRSDSLFAPELAVHIAAFATTGYSRFGRIVERGKPDMPGDAPTGHLRWTVSMPNGRRVAHDSALVAYLTARQHASAEVLAQSFPGVDTTTRYPPLDGSEIPEPGGIREFLTPAWPYVQGASQSAMVVIRLERTK